MVEQGSHSPEYPNSPLKGGYYGVNWEKLLSTPVSRKNLLKKALYLAGGGLLASGCRGYEIDFRDFPKVSPEEKNQLNWEKSSQGRSSFYIDGNFVILSELVQSPIHYGGNISKIDQTSGEVAWKISQEYGGFSPGIAIGINQNSLIIHSSYEDPIAGNDSQVYWLDIQNKEIKRKKILKNFKIREGLIVDNVIRLLAEKQTAPLRLKEDFLITINASSGEKIEQQPFNRSNWEEDDYIRKSLHFHRNKYIHFEEIEEYGNFRGRFGQAKVEKVIKIKKSSPKEDKPVWETEITGANAVASGNYPSLRVSADRFFLAWTDDEFAVVANQDGLLLLNAQSGKILNEAGFSNRLDNNQLFSSKWENVNSGYHWNAAAGGSRVFLGFEGDLFELNRTDGTIKLERNALGTIQNLSVQNSSLFVQTGNIINSKLYNFNLK